MLDMAVEKYGSPRLDTVHDSDYHTLRIIIRMTKVTPCPGARPAHR